MVRAQSDIDIEAPPEVVFAILWDVARYPDYMSDVREIEVHARDVSEQEATFHVDLLRARTYRVRMTGQPPRRVAWTLVEGEHLRANEGSWQIEVTDGGRACHVRYEAVIEFTLPVPDAIVRRMVDFNLPVLLRQVKARAEYTHRRVAGPA